MNVFDIDYKFIHKEDKKINIFIRLSIIIFICLICILNIKISNFINLEIELKDNVASIIVEKEKTANIFDSVLYYNNQELKYKINELISEETYDILIIELIKDYDIRGKIKIKFKTNDIKIYSYIINTMKGWFM